jgi:hypothetical protein
MLHFKVFLDTFYAAFLFPAKEPSLQIFIERERRSMYRTLIYCFSKSPESKPLSGSQRGRY